MKRRRPLILLFVVLVLIALTACSDAGEPVEVGEQAEPEKLTGYDGGPLTGKMVSEMFLAEGGVVYLTADGSVYYEDESGERQAKFDVEPEKSNDSKEEPVVTEDEELLYYFEEDGYIIRSYKYKGQKMEPITYCKDAQGNMFDLPDNFTDAEFIRDGELYYLRLGKIYKVPLVPDGVPEYMETGGTDICAMAEVGDDTVCIKEERDMHAAWLLKEDGTLIQLTEYKSDSSLVPICHLITDGEIFAYYIQGDTEVVFGTLPD